MCIRDRERGVAAELRKQIPRMPLHLSTQGTVYDAAGVQEAYCAGFQRIILSRELSLDEIKTICGKTEAEIEIFVHGAICKMCIRDRYISVGHRFH